ncbi:MAG: type II toxin-antitoxin system VapC family toxin [Acidobacteriota bacterium]|jgi:predicted nucleic acid-binding protein
MIFVDTNVFVLALRYPRDPNAEANERFLQLLQERGSGVTGTVNVLETCGILSFNLNARQLRSLYAHFARRFAVTVLPPVLPVGLVPASPLQLLAYLSRRMSFGDALVAHAVDAWAPHAEAFVSWDARHFAGKIAPPALTPEEFLRHAAP